MNFDFRRFWLHLTVMIQKEFRVIFNDPVSRRILVYPIFIQGLLFGYGGTYNLDNAPYAMLDLSHSAVAVDLDAHIDASPEFERVATLRNQADIADIIERGDAILVVVIPPDFADKLAHGDPSPIQLIGDGRNTMTAGLAAGYVGKIVNTWNEAHSGRVLSIESRTWYNENQQTRWSYLPGLIAMISFTQVVMLAGLSVAKERELGTFDQLLVTPMSPTEILIGKALPPLLIGIVQSTILLLLSTLWFEVPFVGSLATFYLTLFIFTLSSTGIGLVISAIADNMQQVLVYVFVLLLPLALLSGIATPVSNMPEILQTMTYADPLRFSIEAIRRIHIEGATLAQVAPNFPPMLAVAAITLPLAGYLFRHKTT